MKKVIWNSTIKKFLDAIDRNELLNQLKDNFFQCFGEYPDIKQTNAWQSSLGYLANLLRNINLDLFQLLLEYQLPFSGERIDAILIGNDKQNKPTALVIEFKGWSKAKSISDYLVSSDLGNQINPDYQLSNYIGKLKYSHSAADKFNFIGVVVFYNLPKDNIDIKFKNQAFFKNEDDAFENFLLNIFENPTSNDNIKKFVEGEYSQNKKLFSAIRKHFDEIKNASHQALAESGFGLSNEQLEILMK